jgi:hypothetical protein
MVVDADGVTRAVIDWEWFERYRNTLLAKVAAGKKVIPPRSTRDTSIRPRSCSLWLRIRTAERPAGVSDLAEPSARPAHRTTPSAHDQDEH